MALRVERFAQPEELARFLRHELMHVHDMLSPEFGYSPQLHLPGQNAARLTIGSLVLNGVGSLDYTGRAILISQPETGIANSST